ncbi:hypothetical protein CLU79DRAFT_734692 [Phycomyces nitens]|nr:hypothetical protein CLU79DRAFT_734692 [Phycomyces nitens]
MVSKSASKRNIVVIGGSCAAIGGALAWKVNPSPTHRLIIIETKSHFNHVFGFPRASVIGGFERELFIPYSNLFDGDDTVGKVLNAKAIKINPNSVELDREVVGFGKNIEFDYMIYGAGTTIPSPGRLTCDTKKEGISVLKNYQQVIKASKRPIIIGAGAVGLELAAEIKEHYPEKEVTLLHSRDRYLPRYKISLHDITYNILKKHGVRQIIGDRVILPPGGFPLKVNPITIKTKGGNEIEGDLAIMCIGMTPNSSLIAELSPKTINQENGFIKVKNTMQLEDSAYPHIFAAGDVVDHKDVKTGHFAWMQGMAAYENIRQLTEGVPYEKLKPYVSKDVALIKLILGNREASMQTNVFGPLITVGSWIAGRSIPTNVYASAAWGWVNTPLDDEHADQ